MAGNIDIGAVSRGPAPSGPAQLTVTPDQLFAWVAADRRGTVQKIDPLMNSMVETIRIAPDAGGHGISFSAGRQAAVCDQHRQ